MHLFLNMAFESFASSNYTTTSSSNKIPKAYVNKWKDSCLMLVKRTEKYLT